MVSITSRLTWTQPDKKAQLRYAPNYNSLDACIRLHLSSLEDPEILTPGLKKHCYNTMWNKYPAFKNVQIKLPPFENNINEYALSQFSEIENQNKISLVVYELFDHKNGKDMELRLIRKGKTNIPQERIIYLLQINKNHVCYIKNISIFLKRFYNVAKDHETCRNCYPKFVYIEYHFLQRLHYHLKTQKCLLNP